MKLSLVLIVYRSNSFISLEASKFCEEALKSKNIKSKRIESDLNKHEIEKFLCNAEIKPDIGIILGGDGTFLRCANALAHYDIPLLSINIGGNLGFLTQEKHFLVDKSFMNYGEIIPMDAQHLHYGKGDTTVALTLPSGPHTLTLQFANGLHMSYGEQYSKSISIYVK